MKQGIWIMMVMRGADGFPAGAYVICALVGWQGEQSRERNAYIEITVDTGFRGIDRGLQTHWMLSSFCARTCGRLYSGNRSII
jgi:hypothetical protein